MPDADLAPALSRPAEQAAEPAATIPGTAARSLQRGRGRRLSGKGFAPALIATAVILLALVAALNLVVDPYLLYGSGRFEPLVQSNREDKAQLVLERPTPPDVVIVGSSRSERLRPAHAAALCGLPAFNASVSRATPTDFLVWARFLVQGVGHAPRLIVASLDIESLNPVQAWMPATWLERSRLAAYADAGDLAPGTSVLEADLRQLFSWQQTLDSLTVLWGELTHSRPARRWFYDADGAFTLPDNHLPPGALPDSSGLIAFFQNYPALAADALATLERFAVFSRDAGIGLIVYLPPYSAATLADLRAQTPFEARRAAVVADVGRMAAAYGFRFEDLSEVSSFGGDPAAFLNGDHINADNGDHVLDYLLSDCRAAYGL